MEKAAGEGEYTVNAVMFSGLRRALMIDPKKLAKLARLSATTPPLLMVENFIVALTAANDGGFLLRREYQHPC